LFLAASAPSGPGNRFEARLANGLPTFFANAKFLVLNPPQGIVNGFQELAVYLIELDLHGGADFIGSHVDRVPLKFTCGGKPIDQTPAAGDSLPLRKEEIFIVKQLALVHGRHPALHGCWEGWTQFSTQMAELSNFHFIGKEEFEKGSTVPHRDSTNG
jgi:hypothetical protein